MYPNFDRGAPFHLQLGEYPSFLPGHFSFITSLINIQTPANRTGCLGLGTEFQHLFAGI